MTSRVQPGRLRRELRFSRALVDKNLETLGLARDQVKPLLEALMTSDGMLGLYGNELLLLEKALGIRQPLSAVRLVGELVSVKSVPANTNVSYGYISKTSEPTQLGLVALGFSDGLPRNIDDRFEVSIGNEFFSAIGRMAMDQFVIDLGTTSPQLGAEVELFGESFPLSKFADLAGVSELEILGRINLRVDRVWVD